MPELKKKGTFNPRLSTQFEKRYCFEEIDFLNLFS
jgi:hypothetical protein